MATSAGATPGTPASRIPRPSWGRSRNSGSLLDAHPAGDLAHRGQERQAAPRVAQRLVGDGRDAAVDDGSREGLVGGEVKVGEDHLAGAQQGPLGGLRLLDLDDQVRAGPDLRGRVNDGGAGGSILRVDDAAALPRAGFDQDLVARTGQFLGADRQHGHPVFIGLDLPGNPDNHRIDSPRRPWPGRASSLDGSCTARPRSLVTNIRSDLAS